jgi:tyrosyl-tRNA synthetase
LLEGLDGVNKMSKSLDNYIGITDAPQEMFGKLMSISDELMWRYLELLSFESMAIINAKRESVEQGANPRDIKFDFAKEIVERFHGFAAGRSASIEFIALFRQGVLPDDMPEINVSAPEGSIVVPQLLKQAGLVDGTSEAMRMILQGAVKLDGVRINDKSVMVKAGTTVVAQVGKRKFARITIR